MSRRADRLFRIVQLLRARRLVTAEHLADELEVSRRTIYRDVRDLVDSGVPIRGEAGVGYALHRGYDLPPLTFNAEEIEALVLGARLVQAWSDPDLARAARSAMTKVEAVLPEQLRRVILDTALFVPRGPWATVQSQQLGTLRRAVAEGRKLGFAYTRRDGTRSERTVRPLGLYFWGRTWSVASWCELRGDFRNFRPDRMTDIELLTDTWSDEDGTDLAAYRAAMQEQQGMPPGWSGLGPTR